MGRPCCLHAWDSPPYETGLLLIDGKQAQVRCTEKEVQGHAQRLIEELQNWTWGMWDTSAQSLYLRKLHQQCRLKRSVSLQILNKRLNLRTTNIRSVAEHSRHALDSSASMGYINGSIDAMVITDNDGQTTSMKRFILCNDGCFFFKKWMYKFSSLSEIELMLPICKLYTIVIRVA
jgi:hypothetical protein